MENITILLYYIYGYFFYINNFYLFRNRGPRKHIKLNIFYKIKYVLGIESIMERGNAHRAQAL